MKILVRLSNQWGGYSTHCIDIEEHVDAWELQLKIAEKF